METIGCFTVNDNNEITSDPDDFFFPQVRRDTQEIKGENLKEPEVSDCGGVPILALKYFLSNPAKLDKFDDVVFCNRGVLRHFALLIDQKAYSKPWTMQIERRHHNGKTIFLLWKEYKPNSNNAYIANAITIGKNLERHLIPSTEKDNAKRYFARKLNGIKINNKKVPVYFGAEIDGFRDRDGVEIKAEIKKNEFDMSFSAAFDTHVQNHFGGTALSVYGYYSKTLREVKLISVEEYDNDQLKDIYKKRRVTSTNTSTLSIEDAMEMVQTSLNSIINKIEKNQRCNFFAIHSDHTIIECSTESLFSPFPDSFLKQ